MRKKNEKDEKEEVDMVYYEAYIWIFWQFKILQQAACICGAITSLGNLFQ